MSKRFCRNCKSTKVVWDGDYAGSVFYRCENCKAVGMSDMFSEKTLFHQITTSPEVLAPKFVYYTVNRDQFGTYYWYCSALIPGEKWSEEAKAIAATGAKLKEVAE